ncbi:hypothetical protein FA09DRAFT_346443, partial [Tilletiopsis washingtonensis]
MAAARRCSAPPEGGQDPSAARRSEISPPPPPSRCDERRAMPSVCGRPRILRSIGAHQKRASSPRHGTHKRRRARRCSHASGRGSAHDAASGWAAMAEQGCAMVEAGPCGRGRLLSAVFWLWAPMMTKDARDVPPAAAPLVHTAEACVWAASRCCACAGRRPLGIGPSGAPLMGTTICTRCSCAAA